MAKQETTENPYIVHADPAKGFFVSMLIKDITLRDAIGDLVDNAVDGVRAKAKKSDDFSGYSIEITLGKNFSIIDNGSGLEAETARKYAFNFGKSNSHHLIQKSIGQFGIGMKRAFFKIGKKIHINSISKTSQFELTIDVPKWLENPSKWEFQFDDKTLQENIKNPDSKTGIAIHISNLSEDSITSFNDEEFVDALKKEIAIEHMLNINKGLVIKVNGLQLTANKISLVNDSLIKPTFWEETNKDQSVRILAGISEPDINEGGWNVFCNDRLILAHNQESETGWGDGFAKFHGQYNRFRGYVFFEAVDSAKLPWNTTKTGMDLDSPYYRRVKAHMKAMTLSVFEMLNKLKEEKEQDNPEEVQTLNTAVKKSLAHSSIPVTKILSNTKGLKTQFQYPKELFNPPAKSNAVKISYQVSNEKYEAVRQHTGDKSPKDVGLTTFNHFYEEEL